MTDEKLIEVIAHAIDPDVMEATTNGAFADVNEDVGRRQRETRERADEVLRSLRSAGYEIVPAGAVAEARAETHMYAEWRDQWQAKAEALAEAAEQHVDWLLENLGAPTSPDTALSLRAALSAFRSNTDGGWRPEVRAFADAMEARLRANDHKGGWKACAKDWLFIRISEEISELKHAAMNPWAFPSGAALHEAADVANFAMMIADVCGALPAPKPEGQGDG